MFTSNLVWEGDRHRPFIICSQSGLGGWRAEAIPMFGINLV